MARKPRGPGRFNFKKDRERPFEDDKGIPVHYLVDHQTGKKSPAICCACHKKIRSYMNLKPDKMGVICEACW